MTLERERGELRGRLDQLERGDARQVRPWVAVAIAVAVAAAGVATVVVLAVR